MDAGQFGRNYPVEAGLAGDARQTLRALLEALEGTRTAPAAQQQELVSLKAASRTSLETQYPNELRLWETVRSVIDRDAIVLCDSTIPGYAATRCFPTYEPLTFRHPHGWVSIGYGFAASLGAKVGAGEREVLCVTGDGGFQYNIQELASGVQHHIAPVVLLFNDNAWGVLERYQKTLFNERYFATDLVNPDFKQLAAAYSVGYELVSSVDELGATLKRIGTPDRLQLVEVATPEGLANFT